MTEPTKGVIALLLTSMVWGLSPLFYAQLGHVPPLEVLCYRGLWALVLYLLVLAGQRRLAEVPRAFLGKGRYWTILIATVLVSINWFGFIYAISEGRTVEAGLGYYMMPLFSVVLGWLVLSEKLHRMQWAAVWLAALAVVLLTYGLGTAPWLSLVLAGTFAAYGLIKKRLPVGPVISVTAEVLLLAPFALAYLVWIGPETALGYGWSTHVLLVLAGPLTATPLIFFAYGARRVRLATVGIMNYVNPTLQVICATLILAEPFTDWHAITFPMIWVALALYSFAAIRQERASRSAGSSAVISGRTET